MSKILPQNKHRMKKEGTRGGKVGARGGGDTMAGGGGGHEEPMSMDMGIRVYDGCICAWGGGGRAYGHMGIWFHGLMLLGWHVTLIQYAHVKRVMMDIWLHTQVQWAWMT